MHVIYDGRLMDEYRSGLGRFTGELLSELLKVNSEDNIKYTVIIRDDTDASPDNIYYQRLRQYKSNGICQVVAVPIRPISLKQHFFLSRFIDRLGGDLYCYPHFDLPFSVRTPSVAVIHDLTILKIRRYLTKHPVLKTAYFKLMMHMIARKAKFIFAVSKTTRRDFLAEVGQHFSDKVGVCLEGTFIESLSETSVLSSSFTLPEHFLLYVGVRLPHKNLKRIIDLFTLLKEKGLYSGSLLLAGSTKNYNFDVNSYITGRSDIQVMGLVNDSTLSILYQRMDALVILSEYEGFCLPVIEAGLLRKKMIVSDGGSLSETAPPWAFVLPNDTDLLGSILKIKNYLENPVVLDDIYGKNYTWHRVAQRVRSKFVELMV